MHVISAFHHSSFSFVLATCLGAVSSTAQSQSTVVIPNGAATTEGNDFNNFPWGRGGSGLLHQSIYDAVNFTAQGINHPITITRLRWRPDDMRSSAASSYSVGGTVKLSTCPLASTAVTQTFANQRGPDVTTVFSGPVSWPAFAATPGPCPFHIDIPLTSPFTYDPTLGGLNIEADPGLHGFGGEFLLDASQPLVAFTGAVNYSFAIPPDSSFAGTRLALQAVRLDLIGGSPTFVPMNAVMLWLGL